MKEQIEALAKKMLNKKYKYETYTLLVSDYSFSEDEFSLHIDGKTLPYTIPLNEAEAFLDKFIEAKPMINGLATQRDKKLIINKAQNTTTTLIEILYENIEKVQADVKYVQQANTVNKSVGHIVNALRVEMEFVRLSGK